MGETRDPAEQQRDADPSSLVSRVGLALFGWVTAWALRSLGATWRVEWLGTDPRLEPSEGSSGVHLAALFHESMVPGAWLFRDRGYGVAVSRSRDGDLIRATLLGLGYAEPARGSSSRGGSTVVRKILRQMDQGISVAVLVDGPRGPARAAKTGIISIARLSGKTIQPIAISARPALRLRSWDETLIPLPFARVVCAFGEPLRVPEIPDESEKQAAARELDRRLNGLLLEADRPLL
jgi:lysophospholipid acyltransferase (LPLAT)-like uncharacterized protein